jgi:O-antigen/teichoic acid export membrane protein
LSELDSPGLSRTGTGGASGTFDASRTQVRGSSLLFAGQVLAVALNLATQILIVRHLSKTSYGAFAYALSIVALAEAFAAFGLRRGVSRFVPIYEERGDLSRAAGTLVFALATVLGLGAMIVLLVIGLRGVIADAVGSEPEAVALLSILILLAPVQAVENLLDGAFAVFARPRIIFARRFLYTPGMRLAVVALLILSGSGVTFLAYGYFAAGAVGVAIYAALLVRVLREHGLLEVMRGRRMSFPVRQVLRFTVPLLTNDLVAALMSAAGVVILGILAGTADVAEFRAVLPVSLTITYVLGAFGTLFVPLASRLYARDDAEGLNRLYWQTAAWSAVFAFPVFALAFVFGGPLAVLLFGERYADSGAVLSVLVLGTFVTAALGPNGVVLAVFERIRYIVATNAVAMALNLLLAFALIPVLGALGAAIATSGTLILVNAVRQVGLGRRTPVLAVDRHYVHIYALLALLTGILLAANAVFGPPLLVAGLMVVAASVLSILVVRRALAIWETFPELARLPGIGRLLGTRASIH